MIPEGITGAELDRSIKAELRSLPRTLADLVAQHLVAAGRVMDGDPELAYQHAMVARRLAARLGGVREAVAITAYYAEHYDEALTEFRAVRRMTGNHEVLPSMADCERALGRPEKALALSRDKHVRDLSEAGRIEMLIVAAGARRDLGQTAAAIQALEVPELTKRSRADWVPRIRYAYADALADAGRTDEALVWFHRAAGADADGLTGAAERAAELEGLVFTDLDEDDHTDGNDQSEYAEVSAQDGSGLGDDETEYVAGGQAAGDAAQDHTLPVDDALDEAFLDDPADQADEPAVPRPDSEPADQSADASQPDAADDQLTEQSTESTDQPPLEEPSGGQPTGRE